MTRSEMDKLMALVKTGPLNLASVGMVIYFGLHKGDILTFEQIEADTRMSSNTIHKHLRFLTEKKIIEVERLQRGNTYNICPTNIWEVGGIYIPRSSITNVFNQKEEEIHRDLEKKAKRKYRWTKTVKSLIRARLAEGYTVADFKKVHTNMMDWLDSEKMNEYYRPQTLYQVTKFPMYLDKLPKKRRRKDTTAKWEEPDQQREVEQERAKLRRQFDA